MKRVLSILLCAAMLLGVLCACTTLVDDNKGMEIDIYLGNELFDFDPALHYNDTEAARLMNLLYEGITDLDANGKWQKAMMKSYEIKGNDEDGYSMLITLKSSRWSDGRYVQASDFVYAWKRILNAEFQCEAASLLYDVKNAHAAKLGDASIDEVGIAAVDTYVIQIDFEKKIDFDLFLVNLASPALAPLREDIVSRDANWSKVTSKMLTNGPFDIKSVEFGKSFRLERSSYYYLNEDGSQALDTYVIPYRMTTHYDYGDLEAQLAKFQAGELFYLGEIPLSARAEYAKKATITDELATHAYFFNVNNPLFSDARVRNALSMAIDRNALVEVVTYAKAATGLIPDKAFDATNKTSFRSVGGELIKTTADLEGAKALLKDAGVTGGTFTISIRPNEDDRAIAAYVESVWESLGFDITVEEVMAQPVPLQEMAYSDEFTAKYVNGTYDVIAVDFQMMSPDAITALAPFAAAYSGNGVDMQSANYDLHIHSTGYNSDAYNALIASAYAENDRAKRTTILHQAEELLLQDMPIVPLLFLQDAYLTADGISGCKTTYFGTRDFRRMQLKNYMDYLPVTTKVSSEDTDNKEN